MHCLDDQKGEKMPELDRRGLLEAGAVGAVAAAGLVSTVRAATAQASTDDGPTLPKSSESNRFDYTTVEPDVVRPGGTVTECTGHNFPVLVDNSAASFFLVLKPGAAREPHWHPDAWEFDVPLSGRGRLGVANPDDTYSVQEILPGQIGFIPQGYAHYIENIGSEDMRWVVIFNNTDPDDIGLSTMFGGMPTHTFTDTFRLPASTLAHANKPSGTLFIVEPSS
jgi:oxalate decarboxylase